MSGVPSGDLSWMAAQGFASLGQIDPVAGLSKLKVYVFAGTKDQVVHPPVVVATRDFFHAAGVPSKNIAYVHKLPAGHAFIAPSFGNACATNGTPYIDRCTVNGKTYDQPMAILQHVYGTLNSPATTLSSVVRLFDQRDFANAATSLDSVGFVYIPKDCATDASGCAVHVVFHGCEQGAQSVGSDVYASAGYNRWADQPIDRVVPPGRDEPDVSAKPGRLLGLVGLHRPHLPGTQRCAAVGGQGDGRSADRAEVTRV
jgi:hypothetical protein